MIDDKGQRWQRPTTTGNLMQMANFIDSSEFSIPAVVKSWNSMDSRSSMGSLQCPKLSSVEAINPLVFLCYVPCQVASPSPGTVRVSPRDHRDLSAASLQHARQLAFAHLPGAVPTQITSPSKRDCQSFVPPSPFFSTILVSAFGLHFQSKTGSTAPPPSAPCSPSGTWMPALLRLPPTTSGAGFRVPAEIWMHHR